MANLDGTYQLCTLADISEGQKWKSFLMLILTSYGHRVSKKCTSIIVPFARVKAASQPHVKLYMTLCMRGGGRVKEDQGDVFSLDLYGARFEPQLFPDR